MKERRRVVSLILAFIMLLSLRSPSTPISSCGRWNCGTRTPCRSGWKTCASLLRMLEYCRVELDENRREYVVLADVGTYDKSIITDELLNAPSDLPEVTQAALPSEWKGAGLSARKQMASQYLHFDESDVRFLAENGFNFGRLFFSFESLRYPDYPADVRSVNLCELCELDQLLAWCMKYGVHCRSRCPAIWTKVGATSRAEMT